MVTTERVELLDAQWVHGSLNCPGGWDMILNGKMYFSIYQYVHTKSSSNDHIN
jgi:hypothetical protein